MNCPGCGRDYDPASKQQTRCAKCTTTILSALGGMSTGSVVAMLERERVGGWKKAVTLDDAVELLNAALDLDPRAITELVRSRVRVNLDLAGHPTIKALPDPADDEVFYVGFLGFLNGLFGVQDGTGAIVASQNPHAQGHIQEFVKAADYMERMEDPAAEPEATPDQEAP